MRTRLKWVQYLGFVAVGVAANIIGPMLPAIRPDLHINYSQAGLLLSGQFIGMLITALIGGYLIDRMGSKYFLLVGGAFLFTGLMGSMFSRSYTMLYMFNLLTGIGFGIYEVGINALCADSSDANKGDSMSFLHFFYGAGAISGPILAAMTIRYLGSWRLCFGISAVFPLVVSALLLGCRISVSHISKVENQQGKKPGPSPLRSIFVWIIGFTAFFYVGIETSTGGWVSEFWKASVPNSSIPPALIPSVFWGSLTIGRLFAGRIADRIGLMKYLLAAAAGTLILTAAWNFVPMNIGLLMIVSLIGFALSGQFPTLMAVLTSSFPGKSGITSAFLTAFAGIGGFLIPSGIGKIADTFGIHVLSLCILGFSCFLLLFMALMNKYMKKLNIE